MWSDSLSASRERVDIRAPNYPAKRTERVGLCTDVRTASAWVRFRTADTPASSPELSREVSSAQRGTTREHESIEAMRQAAGEQLGEGVIDDARGLRVLDRAASVEADELIDVEQAGVLADEEV